NAHGPSPTYHGTRALGASVGSGLIELLDGTVCPAPTAAWALSGDEDEASIPGDWYSDEDVLAGYAMGRSQLGTTNLVYGLRYEHTRARYAGKTFDGDVATPVVYRNKYGFLAPSLNIRHGLGDG